MFPIKLIFQPQFVSYEKMRKSAHRRYEDLIKPHFLVGILFKHEKSILDAPFLSIENQLVYREIQKRKNNHE